VQDHLRLRADSAEGTTSFIPVEYNSALDRFAPKISLDCGAGLEGGKSCCHPPRISKASQADGQGQSVTAGKRFRRSTPATPWAYFAAAGEQTRTSGRQWVAIKKGQGRRRARSKGGQQSAYFVRGLLVHLARSWEMPPWQPPSHDACESRPCRQHDRHTSEWIRVLSVRQRGGARLSAPGIFPKADPFTGQILAVQHVPGRLYGLGHLGGVTLWLQGRSVGRKIDPPLVHDALPLWDIAPS